MASQIADRHATRTAIARGMTVADFREHAPFDVQLVLRLALPADPWRRRAPRHEHDGTATLGMAVSSIGLPRSISRTCCVAHHTHAPCLSCNNARVVSRELNRLPVVDCETVGADSVQSFQRRLWMLLLVSMTVLDTMSLGATGVARWRAESRCEKGEGSRHEVAHGHGHGSCEGLLLDAAMGPQRRLRSTSGLPPRRGTALGLGCYAEAMRMP